jgi:exodeoxyribonuclease VII large subunit
MLDITRALTVSQLSNRIRLSLEKDKELYDVVVRGELSNFIHHSSGHMYFTLKDQDASIRCVMFKSWNQRVKFTPRDGHQVFLRGDITFYGKSGNCQVAVYGLEPAGQGELALAFAQLKEKLAAEGLFDQERKRPLPPYPRRVGIVTAPQGAALQDFLVTARQLAWPAQLILAPAQVQGAGGAQSVATAIRALNIREVDLVVVTRGGGSLEELWVFNEEKTARAVAASPAPVISAVGHETDFTICDFVADARAATPTAAARLALPDVAAVQQQVREGGRRMAQALTAQVRGQRRRLDTLANRPILARPWQLFLQPRQTLDYNSYKLSQAFWRLLEQKGRRLDGLYNRLEGLSPLAVLKRGFAVIRDHRGIISSVSQLEPGQEIRIQLADGWVQAAIIHRGREKDE